MFKRVLITGAAGFIGSHLADHYLAQGADVCGVDNLLTGHWSNFPCDHAEHHTLDIVNRHRLYDVANRFQPDLVLHCAASYSEPDLWHRDTDTNVAGSINATLVSRHHQAKLCYFNTALPPINSYAISKVAGGAYITMGAPTSLTFRLANVYGPRNVSGPIPAFYRKISEGFGCTIVKTRRELVYIDDLIRGVSMFVDQNIFGVYDMCSGSPVTIREIFDAVCDTVGVYASAVEVDPGDDDVPVMSLNPYPAAQQGWVARIDIDEGIRGAVAWYREHGVGKTYTHLRLKK